MATKKMTEWTPEPGPKPLKSETTVSYAGKGPRGKKGLVEMYADKLDVRQKRAEVSTPLADRLRGLDAYNGSFDPPGRQTSPEVASLAGRILSIPKDQRTKWVLAQPSETLAEWLVILAANALGQANE